MSPSRSKRFLLLKFRQFLFMEISTYHFFVSYFSKLSFVVQINDAPPLKNIAYYHLCRKVTYFLSTFVDDTAILAANSEFKITLI